MQQIKQFKQSKVALPFSSQPIRGGQWVNIGPAPLNGKIGSPEVFRPMSGRVGDVAVDPNDLAHWLIGAAQGGIWETRDAGVTWSPRTDDRASLTMGGIAFAPSNSNIVYAGTGEAVFSGDAYAGGGLLKSTDGGTHWQPLAAPMFKKNAFSDLKVDPEDPDTVLAAVTASGKAGLGGEDPPDLPEEGIFKSTDGGVNWSQRLNGGDATDLEVDPGDFNRQYAGINQGGVYRSTDAGETWEWIDGPWGITSEEIGRVELAIASSNPNVLYVSIGRPEGKGLLGLWRTDNAWDPTPAWTPIPAGDIDDGTGEHGYCGWDPTVDEDNISDQCNYNHEIIVDPNDPNVLYAGGIALWKFDGTTWTEVSNVKLDRDPPPDPNNAIHVDQHSMAWAGDKLIVGNDGGVWSTTDGGKTWDDHNTTLSITQFYAGSLHPTNPNRALAGAQDNGTVKWIGTNPWEEIMGGDGSDSAISSDNPDTHLAVSSNELTIERTRDGESFENADPNNMIDKTNAPLILKCCPKFH